MARRGLPLLIMRRVQRQGRGWVFSPRDFLDLGKRAAVDQALKRLSVRELHRDLETEGHLEFRRLALGLYDYPRWDLDGTAALPSPEAIARAIGRRDGHRVLLSGAHHAHALGLTQLGDGARYVLLTDGPDRTYALGARTLELRHAPAKLMAWSGHSGAPVVLALAWLGPQLAEPAKQHLRARGLTKACVEDLQRNLWLAPSWMQPVLRELVGARRASRRNSQKKATAEAPAQPAADPADPATGS